METKRVRALVTRIINLLLDRKGFADWWENIDNSDCREIRTEIGKMILKESEKKPVSTALRGLPVNCAMGFYQLEKHGEIRTAWQMHHAFGDLLADAQDADTCYIEGCAEYDRRQSSY